MTQTMVCPRCGGSKLESQDDRPCLMCRGTGEVTWPIFMPAAADLRKAAGKRIDPATCEVWFRYGWVLDPYGEHELAEEEQVSGRNFFAGDPIERIAVSFDDLPGETIDRLRGKQAAADAAGWQKVIADADAADAEGWRSILAPDEDDEK